MDLKRVALGLHRKSYRTAEIFLKEAKKRKAEVDMSTLPPYMQKMVAAIDHLDTEGREAQAEDALLYSTRIQNYVLYASGVL